MCDACATRNAQCDGEHSMWRPVHINGHVAAPVLDKDRAERAVNVNDAYTFTYLLGCSWP